MIKTPSGRRQAVGYLQSMVELIPGKLKTNPDHRLELDFILKQLHARKPNTLTTPHHLWSSAEGSKTRLFVYTLKKLTASENFVG